MNWVLRGEDLGGKDLGKYKVCMRKKVKFDLIRVKEDGKEVWKDGSLII